MLYMLKDEIERRFILVSDENLTMLLDKVGFYIAAYFGFVCLPACSHIREHTKYIVSWTWKVQ